MSYYPNEDDVDICIFCEDDILWCECDLCKCGDLVDYCDCSAEPCWPDEEDNDA